MSIDLERALHDLGAALPQAPSLETRVVARLRASRTRRRRVAFAVLAACLAAGLAFAVPPSRSAILDFLGFGPVEIQRVETLPSLPAAFRGLDLGRPVTPAAASRAAGFRVLLPRGRHVRVYLRGRDVTVVDGRLLVSELQGLDAVPLAHKLVGPGTRVEETSVAGRPALWLSGTPHVFAYLAPDGRLARGRVHLAGDTLLWQRGDVVLRLEGARSKAHALRAAALIR